MGDCCWHGTITSTRKPANKINQSQYPWSQNVVSIGLLKIVKGRWACLPLAFRFYPMKKTIDAGNVQINNKTLPFRTKFEQAVEMLSQIADAFRDTPLLIVTDSWFGNDGLFKPMRRNHQRGRQKKYGRKLGCATTLAKQVKRRATTYSVNLYGKQREIVAYNKIVMPKTLKCAVRVVWVYRKSQWVALFSTDLDLSVVQIVEYYGARWNIESGFKEIKQEIGSSKSQTWNPHAVTNHLNFCMMATTVTWVYADHLDHTPKRCYAVNKRKHFAFSDVRKLITQAALGKDFVTLCPKPHKPKQNAFIRAWLRMVA